MIYQYIKALHIIFIVTWFAGLFYIVRLFIYHTEALSKEEPAKSILSDQIALMSRKLWFIITWPSMILTLVLGPLLLALSPGWLSMPFMHIKFGFVFLLVLYHLGCHLLYRMLQRGAVKYSSIQLRIYNEIATIILFAVVFLIVLKSELDWIWGTVGLITFSVMLMLAVKVYKRIRMKK